MNNPERANGLLDSGYPKNERFPRVMRVEITTTNGYANTRINGKPFGNPLTDNRWHDDGYKYHDIFHVAHATFLGWSPTLRGLLGRKRRSDPMVDEIEDGGRAIVIEEGLTAFVFAYAETQNFFAATPSLQSPGDEILVNALQMMTRHLEVGIRTRADWEKAILCGYHVWRNVKANAGGTFTADLRKRTITVE